MDSLISASKSAMQKPIATVNKDSSTVTSMPCWNSSAYGAINEKLLNLIKPSILIPFSFSVSFLSQSVFVYPAKKACPCNNLHPDKIPVLKIVCHKKLPHSVCFASCSSFSAVFICFSAIFSYLAGTFLPYSVTASVSSAATSPFSSRSPSYFSPEASAFASAIYSSREPSAFAAAIASLTAASSSALPLDTPMEDPTTSYGTSATISRSG